MSIQFEFNSVGMAEHGSKLHFMVEFVRQFQRMFEKALNDQYATDRLTIYRFTELEVNEDNSITFDVGSETRYTNDTEYSKCFEHIGPQTMPADIVAKGYEAWKGFFLFCSEKEDAVAAEKKRAKEISDMEARAGIQIDANGTKYVWRWVPTFVNKEGTRQLMGPAQGRRTFATKAEVDAYLTAVRNPDVNNPKMLRDLYGDVTKMEPRECRCYPGHFDPMGIYFDA